MNRAERRQKEKLAKQAAKKGEASSHNSAAGTGDNPMHTMLHQALAHQQAGQIDEAVALYNKVLELDPKQPDANHLLGVIAFGQNDLSKAEELIRKALDVFPDFPEALNNLATILLNTGRAPQALEHLEKAVALSPDYIDAHYNLGLVYTQLGRIDDAVKAYESLLAKDPNNVKALTNCGNLHLEMGHLDEAEVLQRRNIEIDPDTAAGHNNLGAIYMQQKRFEEATAAFAAAIACDPMYADGLSNMGCALIELERFDEALSMFNTAISLAPDKPSSYNSLSDMLIIQHRYDEAEAALVRALTLQPDFADAHLNMGILKLTRGQWSDGWKHYSWRRVGKSASLKMRNYPLPLWDGKPFEGKTLFIYPEQGGGDYLQFLRFVSQAAERGGKVLLEIPKAFVGLQIDLPDNVETIVSSNTEITIDLHASIMDLPWMLGLDTEEQLSADAYVSASEDIVEQWAEKLGDKKGLRVGIVWAGNPDHRNDKNRSIAPEMLAPLSDIGDVSLYSLQVGLTSDRFDQIGKDVIDLSGYLSDYVQTAGALSQMDLVISVDTSVVHLAGAMGVPAWILIPKVPDWRWMLDRDDNPWYSKAKLYRQDDFGAWGRVIERLKADLEALAQH